MVGVRWIGQTSAETRRKLAADKLVRVFLPQSSGCPNVESARGVAGRRIQPSAMVATNNGFYSAAFLRELSVLRGEICDSLITTEDTRNTECDLEVSNCHGKIRRNAAQLEHSMAAERRGIHAKHAFLLYLSPTLPLDLFVRPCVQTQSSSGVGRTSRWRKPMA